MWRPLVIKWFITLYGTTVVRTPINPTYCTYRPTLHMGSGLPQTISMVLGMPAGRMARKPSRKCAIDEFELVIFFLD